MAVLEYHFIIIIISYYSSFNKNVGNNNPLKYIIIYIIVRVHSA